MARLCPALFASLALSADETPAQKNSDAPAGPSEITVQQGTLPNPIADEVTLIHRLQLAQGQPGPIATLPGMITVRDQTANLSYAWDPVECRLLFSWRGDRMTDLIYVAEGSAPFAATIGAWGAPEYFGYRLIDGIPEFLYHLGKLAIAERIVPRADGGGWVQHCEVHQASYGLEVTVPERWESLIKPSTGSWSRSVLQLSEEEAQSFSLAWTWKNQPDLPPLPDTWTTPPVPPKTEKETALERNAPTEDAAASKAEK